MLGLSSAHERMVKAFHAAMEAPIEAHILAETQPCFDYMKTLGMSDEQLSIWQNHRRRLYETRNVIEAALAGRTVDTIVDIGANMIFLPMWRRMLPNARLVLGIDESQALHLRQCGEVIDAYHGDFEIDAIPLADESVDLVTMFEVFEHFYVDPMFVFSEVNRILRPGGLFILSAPNSTSWRAILAAMTGYHPYQYPVYAGVGSRRHVHEPAPRDLHLALTAAGFEPSVSTRSCFSPAVPKEFMDFMRTGGFSPYDRDDTVVAVGRKTGPVQDRKPRGLYE